jgi:hypothetical protein
MKRKGRPGPKTGFYTGSFLMREHVLRLDMEIGKRYKRWKIIFF